MYNGYTYNLVCADTLDDKAARVICRELGYPAGQALYPKAFGSRSETIGVTQVKCSGDEERFEDCPMQMHSYSCTKSYASVVCAPQDSDATGEQTSLLFLTLPVLVLLLVVVLLLRLFLFFCFFF